MSKLSDAIKKAGNKKVKAEEFGTATELAISAQLNKLFFYDRKLREDRVGLHASALISSNTDFCFREQVLSLFYKQEDAKHPLGLKRIFEQGIAIHEKWQNLFEMQKIAKGIEYRCYSKIWDVYLTPDAIVDINKKRYIAEIKSVNTFQFKHMTTHPSGQKQMQFYMHFLGIPDAFVLAEDKNSQEIKVFYEKYDPEKVRPYLERLYKIQQFKQLFLKEGTLPPRNCIRSDTKRAQRCNMCSACWKTGIGRQWLDDKLIEVPTWRK